MNKYIKVDISVIFISFGFTKVVISAIFAEIPFYESGRGQGWNMGTKTAAIRRTLALAGNSGREVFSSVNFTSLFVRRCWRIVGSRQPHATPTPVPSARASVPQSASTAARRPAATLRWFEPSISTARNLPVRADHPHTHPSAMTASPIASLKTHTAFLHGHAGLPQLIIAPTSYAARHGCRESVTHDMTQPCTSFRVAPCLYGAYRSIRLLRTLTSGRRSSCGIRTACYSLRSGR